jgi:peptidoglycan/LPS O-acetylase OafA/YrhL
MFTVDGMRRRIFYVIAFIGLIELFLAKKGHVSQYFEKNSCLSISKYCLSVFLTHQVIISLFGKYNILFDDMILQVFVIFVVCLLFGGAVHHLVEKPATKYLQKQFKMISAHKK